jgi:hypothetical protein
MKSATEGPRALERCIVDFEADLRQVAWQLAQRVIADEYAGRQRVRPPRRRRTVAAAPTAPAPSAAPAARPTEPAASPAAGPPSLEPIAGATAGAPTDARRARWTRETVIAELCEWLLGGIVEPAVLRRHGKPGLVTAATRIFGRFDSALNVANLQLAKQYPDGPPTRRGAMAQ